MKKPKTHTFLPLCSPPFLLFFVMEPSVGEGGGDEGFSPHHHHHHCEADWAHVVYSEALAVQATMRRNARWELPQDTSAAVAAAAAVVPPLGYVGMAGGAGGRGGGGAADWL